MPSTGTVLIIILTKLIRVSLFFFRYYRNLQDLHSFPTRRSSDLAAKTAKDLKIDPARGFCCGGKFVRSEEHTSELQSRFDLVCRLLLEKKNAQASKAAQRERRCQHVQAQRESS